MTDDWKQDRIRAAHEGRNPAVLAKLPETFAVRDDRNTYRVIAFC